MPNATVRANAPALPTVRDDERGVYAFTRGDRIVIVGAALSAALTLACVVGLFALLAPGR
jgi:hypothetical protein